MWNVLGRQETSSPCFLHCIPGILKVPALRLMQTWGCYVRRGFEIVTGRNLVGFLSRRTLCAEHPQVSCRILPKALLQEFVEANHRVLQGVSASPNWHFSNEEKGCFCWKNSNSSFKNRLRHKCLKAFLRCVIFCHKITSKTQLSSKTRNVLKIVALIGVTKTLKIYNLIAARSWCLFYVCRQLKEHH